MKETSKFKTLGLSQATLDALDKKGFEEPTAIQEKCIPIVLKDKMDIVGQAQTGTGKTAAFGLPVIEIINPDSGKVQALILTPTRELAIQISEELNTLKGEKRVKIAAIYGGQFIGLQMKKLREGAQIVVGTPGRVIDHINRGKLLLGNLDFFILDEADEMLNMGFIDDVEKILAAAPQKKRMMLFSATMPARILNLAKKYMPDYKHIKIESQPFAAGLTDQIYFEVMEADKFEALSRIIDVEPEFYGLIFCRTKNDVDAIAGKLVERGYDAAGIHGGIIQNQREKIYYSFKNKKINILVATDVAARGIDVSDLTHVINYALPQDSENYLHRIGRTGRAGKQGTAITFITPYEYRKLNFITKNAKASIRKKNIPEIREIIEVKKNKILSEIKDILVKEDCEDFAKFAAELSENQEPARVIAALLQYSFRDELDSNSYNEIRQSSIDNKGKSRLFVAKGSRAGMTKRKLAEFITKKSGVRGSLIDDIRLFDDYSFVSVPFNEAEKILRAFKNENIGRGPVVTKAKMAASRS